MYDAYSSKAVENFPKLVPGDPDLCSDGIWHAWRDESFKDGLRHCMDCPATRRASNSTGPELGLDDCHSRHSSGVPCHFLVGHEDRGQTIHFNPAVSAWRTE